MLGNHNVSVNSYSTLGYRPPHYLSKSTSMPTLYSQYRRSGTASSAAAYSPQSSTASSSGVMTPSSSGSTRASSPFSGSNGAGIPLRSQSKPLDNASHFNVTMPAKTSKPKYVEMLGFSYLKDGQFRVHGTIHDKIGQKQVDIRLYRPSLVLHTLRKLNQPRRHFLLWTKYAGATIDDVSFVGDVTWAKGAWSVTFLDTTDPNADPHLLPGSKHTPIIWPVRVWECTLPKKNRFRVRFYEEEEHPGQARIEALM